MLYKKTIAAFFIVAGLSCTRYKPDIMPQALHAALADPINTVPDIPALQAYSGPDTLLRVFDTLRGGLFAYKTTGFSPDSGIVFRATGKGQKYWVRQYDATAGIMASWFNIKGDSTEQDSRIQYLFTYMQQHGTRKATFSPGVYLIKAITASPGEPELVLSLPYRCTLNCYGARFTSNRPFCFRTEHDSVNWNGGEIVKGRMVVSSSTVNITDLTISYSWSHAFHLSTGKSNDPAIINKYYRHVIFKNCFAYRSARHGFSAHRGSYAFTPSDTAILGNISDLQYINCRSEYPSWKDDGGFFSKYDYGFGLENIKTATNVKYTNCTSIAAPGAGWHSETAIQLDQIVFDGCLAQGNGRSIISEYGCGFFYREGYSFTNCRAVNNVRGGFSHLSPFKGDGYIFQNCSVDSAATFSHQGEQHAYALNPATKGDLTGSLIYTEGSATMPVKGLDFSLFGTASVTEGGQLIRYFYNTQNLFISATLPTSIASIPVTVTNYTTYAISIGAKELAGTTGQLMLYVQEFDENFKLLKNGTSNYSYRMAIPAVTSAFQQFNYSLNKIKSTAKYMRAVLVFTDASGANKQFGLSKFSVQLQ